MFNSGDFALEAMSSVWFNSSYSIFEYFVHPVKDFASHSLELIDTLHAVWLRQHNESN